MKTNNKQSKGFFARLLALVITAVVMVTDCTVVKAAEPATGIKIEIIGDLEIVIKRESNYVDSGCKVVNEKGQEIPDLTAKVVTKYYEIRQVEGKWQEVLLNPFDTKRIAKVKVRYYLEEKALSAERELDIVDQYDPKYDAWFKSQVAAQKASASTRTSTVNTPDADDGTGSGEGGGNKPSPKPKPKPTPGPGDDTGGDNPTPGPSPSPSPTPGPGDDTGGDNPI